MRRTCPRVSVVIRFSSAIGSSLLGSVTALLLRRRVRRRGTGGEGARTLPARLVSRRGGPARHRGGEAGRVADLEAVAARVGIADLAGQTEDRARVEVTAE